MIYANKNKENFNLFIFLLLFLCLYKVYFYLCTNILILL
nr:MAG TPA: hypothetical protein [Caudoviricetes sp.]